MSSYIASRNCPCCGASHKDAKVVISAKVPAENLTNEELKQFFIGFRKEQCFFTYSRCSKCDLLYCPKYFSAGALDELYSSMPDNTSVLGEKDTARTQKSYVRYFSIPPAPASFLEIGADIGLLAKEFSAKYQVDRVDSVEPNKDVHERFRENFTVPTTVFESVPEVPQNPVYDAEAAIHVIDHLLNPAEDLRFAAAALRQGGQIVIVVHNEKSLLRKVLNRKWPPFCLQHPQLYSRKTIRNILKTAGLETIFIRRTRNYLSLKQILSLVSSIGLFPKVGLERVPEWSIPIPLGNIAVNAKK